MPVLELLKKKYSLNGDQYPARDADRAIQDLIACITRLHSDNEATGIRAANAESKAAALEEECHFTIFIPYTILPSPFGKINAGLNGLNTGHLLDALCASASYMS